MKKVSELRTTLVKGDRESLAAVEKLIASTFQKTGSRRIPVRTPFHGEHRIEAFILVGDTLMVEVYWCGDHSDGTYVADACRLLTEPAVFPAVHDCGTTVHPEFSVMPPELAEALVSLAGRVEERRFPGRDAVMKKRGVDKDKGTKASAFA